MEKKKTYQNLWDAARAVFRRESITLNASVRIAFQWIVCLLHSMISTKEKLFYQVFGHLASLALRLTRNEIQKADHGLQGCLWHSSMEPLWPQFFPPAVWTSAALAPCSPTKNNTTAPASILCCAFSREQLHSAFPVHTTSLPSSGLQCIRGASLATLHATPLPLLQVTALLCQMGLKFVWYFAHLMVSTQAGRWCDSSPPLCPGSGWVEPGTVFNRWLSSLLRSLPSLLGRR